VLLHLPETHVIKFPINVLKEYVPMNGRKEKGKRKGDKRREEERQQGCSPNPCVAGIGHAVVDYGDEHEIGNKSLSYALAPAAKAGSQPRDRQEEGHCLDLLACQLHLLHP
jgi:hypothetical protein